MAIINWSDNLSVEVGQIDDQHKQLIKLINELNDAMVEGKGRAIVSKIISGLADYTVSHFGTEEKYFKQFGYSGFTEHKTEHDNFVKKVSDFKSSYDSGNSMLSIEVMRFLTDWLLSHIKGTDKKYVPCFHENGLK